MNSLVRQSSSVGRSPPLGRALAGVTVVIPALNEESSLPHVLADLPQVGRVIVIDNGSTDSTGAVAQACGADVAIEPQRGYGAACLRGLAEVRRFVEMGESAPSMGRLRSAGRKPASSTRFCCSGASRKSARARKVRRWLSVMAGSSSRASGWSSHSAPSLG